MIARVASTFVIALAACSQTNTSASSPDAAKKPDAPASDQRPAPVSMLTQHNDVGRTGTTTAETCLTPQVAPSLTQIASLPVDGLIFAQPLLIAAPQKNLVIVASTGNELAAFDAATLSTTPVWKLGQETFGIAGNVIPGPGLVGILSTPVIDPATNRIYLIARSCASSTATSNCAQTLHVVDGLTGEHLDSVVVSASFTAADGTVHKFDPDSQMNRPALLLLNGNVFAAWGVMTVLPGETHEENVTYHGTTMAFDTAHLHDPPVVFVATPNGFGGGIWQAGGGLASDGESVYFNTGNATLGPTGKPMSPLDFPAKPVDQENSLVRYTLKGGAAQVASFYDDRPYHADGNVFQYLNFYDYDMASSGVTVIPDSNALVTGSKGGMVYLVDKATMKSLQEPLSPFMVSPLPAGQTLHIAGDDPGAQVNSSPVVWRRAATSDALVYIWPRFDKLTSFQYVATKNTMTVHAISADLGGPTGGALSLSVNGTDDTSAVVWATCVATSGTGGSIRAYDPETLTVLWQASTPGLAKFASATIASGRVYVPTWNPAGNAAVLVFGAHACGD